MTRPALAKCGEEANAILEFWVAQRRIRGKRFLFVHVQRRAGDHPFSQRIDQRLLVHHGAARRIHQEGGGLHPAKCLFVEQMIGGILAFTFSNQRDMNADEVRPTQRRLKA